MFTRLVPPTVAAALALTGAMAAAALPPRPAVKVPVADLGRATAATHVSVAVVLNYRHEGELDRLIDAQSDPSSPLYQHFLTSQQFNAYFSPSAADYNGVIAGLRAGGFTISNTYGNRTVVDATAPAPVAERFFSTEIHNVRESDGSLRYLNVRPETIPAAIRAATLTVVGLDSAHTLHPDYAFAPPSTPRPIERAVDPAGKPLFGPDGGYGPQIFINSYLLPVLSGKGGKGRASGVATDADFLDSDLAAYLAYFGVTRTGPATTRIPIDGGPPKGISGDSVETTLDVETIVSLAPGTALYVYEAKGSSTLQYFTDIYNQAVTDNKVDTMNSSYSECETAFIPSFPKAANAIEKQGAAKGITFHSSTGDYGTTTYGCNSGISVGTPADTTYGVAIGGTIMQVNHTTGQETSEIGWNDGSGATGGGVSTVIVLPQYQKGVTNVIASGRNLPDVSFDASPFTGESYYFDGSFQGPIGGTSLSSPIFGALLTEIDQVKGARAGFFGPKLYGTWKKNGYVKGTTTYIRDITQGSIGPYKAGPGYDQMTGIGAILANNFDQIFP